MAVTCVLSRVDGSPEGNFELESHAGCFSRCVPCAVQQLQVQCAEQCLLLDLSGKFDIVRLIAVIEERVTVQQSRTAAR